MQSLAGVCDNAFIHQADNSIREHLTVYAKVSLLAQKTQNRIRDGADPQLQSRAVRDQAGNVTGDFLADSSPSFTAHQEFGDGIIDWNDVIQAADMDK